MKFRRPAALCCIALWALGMNAVAAPAMPAEVLAAVRESGVPARYFGFYAQPVDAAPAGDSEAIASMNAEQPFLLASTAKVVTSLAALDLLGPAYPWPLNAFTTAPVQGGQMKGRGDLVIDGRRHAISADELSRWFVQMHAEGLTAVTGNIVLDGVLLMPSQDPAIGNAAMAAGTFEPPPPTASGWSEPARQFNAGTMLLSIEAGSGDRARITLVPQPLGVQVVNDVMMASGPCDAWAAWSSDSVRGRGTPQLLVRGRWDVNCPKEYVAYVHPLPGMKFMPNTAPRESPRAGAAPVEVSKAAQVARLWVDSGGTLRGRVIEGTAPAPSTRTATAPPRWSSAFSIPLSQVVREINKTSDNLAACNLLLSLAPGSATPGHERRDAKARVHEWLIGQGLLEGDIHIDLGSGQSREERGKPRAMVQLLRKAWKTEGAQAFVNSLPIAGVDGTLANRMREGSATGQALLKTGTLSDTRALAGYVRSRSGVVYAVAAIVNHPDAARARSALDAFIVWLARNG
jgi:D-alanyl-D-alanine carboxypeptidase/D-alanyl-D-alanine-endopeptidase (penicillin-binding protein 4)